LEYFEGCLKEKKKKAKTSFEQRALRGQRNRERVERKRIFMKRRSWTGHKKKRNEGKTTRWGEVYESKAQKKEKERRALKKTKVAEGRGKKVWGGQARWILAKSGKKKIKKAFQEFGRGKISGSEDNSKFGQKRGIICKREERNGIFARGNEKGGSGQVKKGGEAEGCES